MNRTFTALCSVLAVVFLMASIPLRADLTIEGEGSASSNSSPIKIHFKGNMMQVEADKGMMIVLPDANKMVIVLTEPKAFMERPLQPLVDVSLSKDPGVVFTRTGNKANINGFDCEQVMALNKDNSSAELWFSPQGPNLSEMMPSLKTLHRQNLGRKELEWMDLMGRDLDFKTFPIRIVSNSSTGKEMGHFTIKSVNKDSIPASIFAPPVGYMEIKIPGFPTLGGGPAIAPTVALSPMQQLQQLQQDIVHSGNPPTPDQLQKLQELAKEVQGN